MREGRANGRAEREGIRFRKKGEINKTTPLSRRHSSWGGQTRGALARAFSVQATPQDLIGRSISGHLSDGRSHWLIRGDSPCTPKTLCLPISNPLSRPSPSRSVCLPLSHYLQSFSVNNALSFSPLAFPLSHPDPLGSANVTVLVQPRLTDVHPYFFL